MEKILTPLKLRSVCKDYVWGGTRLRDQFSKGADLERVAESWELSCHENGLSVIDSGEFQGKPLREVAGDLPLLMKFIDACQPLSIQVHPYGHAGKTEMWYVVQAEEGASIGYGFKEELTAEQVRLLIDKGELEQAIAYIPAKKGDAFLIPGGTVHAIGKGLLIAEIQQCSDTTYRLYDYQRRVNGQLRPLHVEEALAVADLGPRTAEQVKKEFIHDGACYSLVSACAYFHVYRVTAEGETALLTGRHWKGFTLLEGEVTLTSDGGSVTLTPGETAYLPCAVKATGRFEALLYGEEELSGGEAYGD